MRSLRLIFLFCLLAGSAFAASTVTRVTLTVTNLPVTTNKLTFTAPASKTITWTNVTGTDTVLTNSTLSGSATNLYAQLAGNRTWASPPLTFQWVNTNSFRIVGAIDQTIAVSQTGNWCSLVSVTNPVGPGTPIRVPMSTDTTNATGLASQLISDLSTYSTNRFSTGAVAMANFAPLTNAPLSFPVIRKGTNIWSGGSLTNPIIVYPILTNGQNFGNPFSSPGSATASEQFGAAAEATGEQSAAIGYGSHANGFRSLGVLGDATSFGSVAIAGSASGSNSVSLGNSSEATAENSVALGTYSTSSHSNSTAIGFGSATTADNQVMLGAAGVDVYINNVLRVGGSITNGNYTGTNAWRGRISYTPGANGGLVNGNNAGIILGTNVWTQLSGPTTYSELAGFVAEPNGTIHEITMRGAATNYVINYTGSSRATDGTAANRIETGTGGDLTLTNNPATLRVIYDASVSRWIVLQFSR